MYGWDDEGEVFFVQQYVVDYEVVVYWYCVQLCEFVVWFYVKDVECYCWVLYDVEVVGFVGCWVEFWVCGEGDVGWQCFVKVLFVLVGEGVGVDCCWVIVFVEIEKVIVLRNDVDVWLVFVLQVGFWFVW